MFSSRTKATGDGCLRPMCYEASYGRFKGGDDIQAFELYHGRLSSRIEPSGLFQD